MSYILIAHQELSSAQAAITFSSIPQTFTDLLLVCSLRSSTTNSDIGIKLNNSTANFSNRYLFGNGSSAASGTAYGNYVGEAGKTSYTASTFGNFSIYIPSYRSSTAKSYSSDAVNENNATTAVQAITAGLWNDNSTISSIELYQLNGANLVEFSSATLYGITAGSNGVVVS
jgi:hypothetical protein